jgi:hypothetical protein
MTRTFLTQWWGRSSMSQGGTGTLLALEEGASESTGAGPFFA